jgi:hypothetical protein
MRRLPVSLSQPTRAHYPTSALTSIPNHPPNPLFPRAARGRDFSGSIADRSGLLALYIACLNRGLLDFYTGGKVLLQSDVDRHHVLPRGQFAEDDRRRADNIANVAFIAGDVNRSIGQAGPEVYLGSLKPRVLRSQCIPGDSALWRVDRAESFWRARRELLADSFNEYVRKALPQRHL